MLNSNQESSIFLYFSDHGAPGFLIFPHDSLYADELEDTIKTMHNKTMYKELVMFIEACESGSLFHNMDLSALNAWALTATNATSPSYGTYCYPHDTISDQHLYTCLGDLFSVTWMEFLEYNANKLSEITLY